MALKADWKLAKRGWETRALPHVRQSALEVLDTHGWGDGDLAAKLGAFDKARDIGGRRVAWLKAAKVVKLYRKGLTAALKVPEVDSRGKAGMRSFLNVLEEIEEEATLGITDPEPSARSTELRVVSKMNLAAGVQAKHLDVPKLEVGAWLVMDTELLRIGLPTPDPPIGRGSLSSPRPPSGPPIHPTRPPIRRVPPATETLVRRPWALQKHG